MDEIMKIKDVENWFLSKQEMSPKKLQKMLYYAYSWGLVFFNESVDSLKNTLFNADFEAWVHGPVIRDVYFEFSSYKYNNIEMRPNTAGVLPDDVEDLLNQVLGAYGDFNGNELESITHSELPWIEARKGLRPMDSSSVVIKTESIFEYYTGLLNK